MNYSSEGLAFAGLTDIGLQRATNQDSYYISSQGDLFIVADGMGGHAGGQEASRLSTKTIRDYLTTHRSSTLSSPALLRQAIAAANSAVLADQCRHPERADMGTTVVIVMLRDRRFWCAHVGDSRLYLLREHSLIQVTKDHTWVAQAMLSGGLTSEEISTHPWRHVLSQCVGREDLAGVEIQPLELEKGDRLLLCSDGLSEELSDEVIAGCLASMLTCETAVASLIETAKTQGGRDNITAIVIAISESAKL
ncbi:Stp1/IreP family PP2C-type Ser/Thr phosphatase [cf. Phormidesmis sp. LEGE 11477]|uniref:Stp1/IreP family PP2C-type Ser/Thr phosphatase n=1 Tax=cf. Phormidesmis sp. LEGE 11477 TaxID=1828680 RepID=UPI00187F99EF|nr:Stp1/IreP family PP2C-type Ser/Thr phosphatase [cf. Phormidesmis sp. LEGE 11477]MBE9060173.1 Stp1/IreP family PP2C-type Ser/Thr phosphatase [cf. Phormidesmis sp. LEGE 11477]